MYSKKVTLLILSITFIDLMSKQAGCLSWMESNELETDEFDNNNTDSTGLYNLVYKRAVPCCRRFSPKCCLYGFECCNSMNHCFSSMKRNCRKNNFRVRNRHFNHLGRTCGSMGYRC